MTNIHDFIFFSCALYFSVPANRASQSGGGKRGIASLDLSPAKEDHRQIKNNVKCAYRYIDITVN